MRKLVHKGNETEIVFQTRIEALRERLALSDDTPNSEVEAAWALHRERFFRNVADDEARTQGILQARERTKALNIKEVEEKISSAKDIEALKSAMKELTSVFADVQTLFRQ